MWIFSTPARIAMLIRLATSWGHIVSGTITTLKTRMIWATGGNTGQLVDYLESLGLTVDGGSGPSNAGYAMGVLGLTYSGDGSAPSNAGHAMGVLGLTYS